MLWQKSLSVLKVLGGNFLLKFLTSSHLQMLTRHCYAAFCTYWLSSLVLASSYSTMRLNSPEDQLRYFISMMRMDWKELMDFCLSCQDSLSSP